MTKISVDEGKRKKREEKTGKEENGNGNGMIEILTMMSVETSTRSAILIKGSQCVGLKTRKVNKYKSVTVKKISGCVLFHLRTMIKILRKVSDGRLKYNSGLLLQRLFLFIVVYIFFVSWQMSIPKSLPSAKRLKKSYEMLMTTRSF